MGYWKTKVLPKIKKVFEKDSAKKAAAAEATKNFDESMEEISKEFEEKKTELGPKVIEIFEASTAEIKTLKFLDELVKIEFPGSKAVSEASSKLGPAYVSGPIFFIFEKVSTFIPVEEKAVEPPAPETKTEEATTSTEKEIVVEEEKKEEVVVAEVSEKAEPPAKVEQEEPPKP
ncbi:PLASMA MEMBRANE-ASSOCIATED CATION-BINDING PROTEIN 1 [Salix koriyanagi]|uniref:PLASMA MEMBRANE-ASSOCIATED CATION-BINDING PROTEIN 1 n=1 Tax=Salix koriyanagi TaxID=2511006 RepID=A0A9Q0T5F6_9ROSI|nr:PLASMA MEMBRANE-ASSOCIATED CATION-BINDING PROTEIN 1 [Salix koriyanagi]